MPNFRFLLKGPTPNELEQELQHLSFDEKNIIMKVIQKDLELKETFAIDKQDKGKCS